MEKRNTRAYGSHVEFAERVVAHSVPQELRYGLEARTVYAVSQHEEA
jgi:hypothetical protein